VVDALVRQARALPDQSSSGGFTGDVGMAGKSAGPGDVAVAGWVGVIGAFAEGPAGTGIIFAQSKVIGGDILVAFGKALFGAGELVHESEAEVVLFAREIHFRKDTAVMSGGFPADLPAESGFVACGPDVLERAEEIKEHGFEELPVLGTTRKKSAQPEFGAFDFINVDNGEIARAAGGDIETEPIFAFGGENSFESIAEKVLDSCFTTEGRDRRELAELLEDLLVFEMETGDFVIATAALDDGPIHNVIGGITSGVAHVGLLEYFGQTGARAAIGEELDGSEFSALNAVDDIEQAEFDRVGHGDAVVQIPWSGGGVDRANRVE
jgi:hypothetical protein